MKQKEIDGHVVTFGIMSGTPAVSIEKKSHASAPDNLFDMLDMGDGTVRVYTGNDPDHYSDISINALRVGLDMLEGKSDDVPSEAETISEPEIDPEVLKVIAICRYCDPGLLKDNIYSCTLLRGAPSDKCPVKTRDDIKRCENYGVYCND